MGKHYQLEQDSKKAEKNFKIKIKDMESHTIYLGGQLSQVEESTQHLQSQVISLKKKMKDKDIHIQELDRLLSEAKNSQFQYQTNMECQFKAITRDFETSCIRIRHLEDPLASLTTTHDKCLKELKQAKLHNKFIEDSVACMQIQLDVGVRLLHKSRKNIYSSHLQRNKKLSMSIAALYVFST